MIKLPLQFLYSKMAQANMKGILTESAFQIRGKQVFAGKRAVTYMDSFYNYMNTDIPQSIQGGLTLQALATFYRGLKVELLNRKDEHSVHGTVEWRKFEGLTTETHGAESSEVIRESGRYF